MATGKDLAYFYGIKLSLNLVRKNRKMRKKVLLGMSGGIDSSVAAMLLLEQGYEVIGATLRLWSEADGFENKHIPNYITEAAKLAKSLGIKHTTLDARQEFFQEVILYFKNEYLAGRTPNPCAKCNVVLKWKLLNKLAEQYQCDYIATGHYTNKEYFNNKYYITKGADPDKEQSFFLWGLGQNILSKALFPLGQLSKKDIKTMALEKGFVQLEQKKESIGVCFIQNNKYHPLLTKLLKQDGITIEPGYFVDFNGKELGKHDGYPFYTVGQRRGLGLSPNQPWYVTQIHAETNKVVLGKRDDLYQNEMWVSDYQINDWNEMNKEVITRIRYRKQAAPSRITRVNDSLLKVSFTDKEWSIAPGQTAAFYQGDRLLGGGFIVK